MYCLLEFKKRTKERSSSNYLKLYYLAMWFWIKHCSMFINNCFVVIPVFSVSLTIHIRKFCVSVFKMCFGHFSTSTTTPAHSLNPCHFSPGFCGRLTNLPTSMLHALYPVVSSLGSRSYHCPAQSPPIKLSCI